MLSLSSKGRVSYREFTNEDQKSCAHIIVVVVLKDISKLVLGFITIYYGLSCGGFHMMGHVLFVWPLLTRQRTTNYATGLNVIGQVVGRIGWNARKCVVSYEID